jgi:tRNA 2-thiouridine synthesizing protein A
MSDLIDVKGLTCPLPVLRVRKRVRELPAGGALTILATDPGAPRDIQALCETAGLEFVGSREVDGAFEIQIRRGA